MNRIQKKCFIASAGTHLLLMVILFVGPAFLSEKSKLDEIQPINFVPENLVLAAVSGGGNPRAATRPPPPPAPAAQITPPQQQQREPDPPKTVETKQNKLDPESLEIREHKHLPTVSTKIVSRNSDKAKKQPPTPTTDTREREYADAVRRSDAFKKAARSLGNSAASATIVDAAEGQPMRATLRGCKPFI